jgi:feruloyl esterase
MTKTPPNSRGSAPWTSSINISRASRLVLAAAAALLAWPAAAQQTCESLTALKLPHTTVTSAVSTPVVRDVPPHCDVKAISRPTSDSEIQLELWMPLTGWNGKYYQVGNGGWAGSIPVGSLAEPLRRGYAVAGTDDGHEGGGADWAVGHPEKLIDFGYRALHETRLQSVGIVNAFYGKSTSRNYFFGCSDGGREALMEAQRFADDFDGIIAGAPANNWTHLLATALWIEQALMDDPASTIPQSKLPVIQKNAIEQCDALDGVKDGLIEDPRVCHVNLKPITCKGADSPECLTAPQIAALQKIYSGPVNPRTGAKIHPGFAPGTEAVAGTWSDWLIPGNPRGEPAAFGFANTFWLQAVYENLKTDFRTLNFDSDVAWGDQKAAALNSTNPDLRSFRAHGGKLIQYHGWGDAAIPAQDSIDYYEAAKAFLAKYPDGRMPSKGEVADFYRLFLVPGMSHCGGGVGPNSFGNDATVAKDDPERDLMTALDRWVEKGVAPDHFIGTGKSMTRPLCPYPKVAKYKGSGDTNDAASFSCYPAN